MGKITGFLEIERVDRDYLPVEERLKNYNEFVIPLGDKGTRDQAARCMDCGIPYCHNGCPVNNQIPDWNDLVYKGEWLKALKNLHSTNNFPEFTGRICPAPCEASCTLNIPDTPVNIKSIECAIIDKGFEEGWVTPQPAAPSAYDREAAMSPAQLMSRWDTLIGQASRKFHVPKSWIRAVMQRESGGRTMMAPGRPIVSSAGAMGLMQVQSDTYEEMAAQYKLGANPFDAHDNIFAGAAYLRWLQKRYGFPAMFAAYNAGPRRVDDHLQHGASLPAETRKYVGHITTVLGKGGAGVLGKGGAGRNTALVKFTRPDGSTVRVDAAKVDQVRAPLPGEYGDAVKTVIKIGDRYQALSENLEIVRSAIRAVGGLS